MTVILNKSIRSTQTYSSCGIEEALKKIIVFKFVRKCARTSTASVLNQVKNPVYILDYNLNY